MSVAVSSYSAPVALPRTLPATACLSRGAAGPVRVSALLRRHATLPSRGRGAALVVRAAEEAAEMVGSDANKLTTSLPSVLDINEIMNRLPHRFPFLLVRRPPGPGRGAAQRERLQVPRKCCAAVEQL